ncbi:MAG: ATP-dependent 6-phosphofructokinase [Promethearchaeia archaeon]
MKVGILTSGGDAPGMNAAIRAVVRVGCAKGFEVVGFLGGLQGLIDKDFTQLDARAVAHIIHRGGTILTTGRSEEFKKKAGVTKAAETLDELGLDALIAIGGDGTMRGLAYLGEHWDGMLIGLPGTIDNDVWGTDYSIGFDTAVNNALEAIDKIRDTADSYARVFLVEVMGRHSGYIAAHVGLASGALALAIPETKTDLKQIAQKVIAGRERGKTSAIIVVAEGDEAGDASAVGRNLSEMIDEKCRVSVLGYIQRGGNPTRKDRLLSSRLGAHAVKCVLEKRSGIMLGEIDGDIVETPFEETWSNKKPLPSWMLEHMDELAS